MSSKSKIPVHSHLISLLCSFRFRLLAVVAVILFIIQWPVLSGQATLSGSLPLNFEPHLVHQVNEAQQAAHVKHLMPTAEYVIAVGDSLSNIFSRLGVSQQTMYQILESDISLLALDTLKPGDVLRFWIDETSNELTQLELVLDLAHKAIYTRLDETSFESKELFLEGQWQPKVIHIEIKHSLGVDGHNAGLSINEIDQISALFKEKIKFSRDLRKGDSFSVLRNQQYIDGIKNDRSQLLAVLISNQHNELSAFLNSDGNYYDAKGKSLSRAFLRYPTKRKFRITSSFNPRRKHPVTGRISPHKGTDFATPIGTPIIATGDGVVSKVKNHPYAGKYIEIDHGGSYRTRFLHLSKFLVSKGQKVTRGKTIALSGNTGRSTGAHLHFEFHINGRAVNAMTTWLPTESSVPKKSEADFYQLVAERMALLEPKENTEAEISLAVAEQ